MAGRTNSQKAASLLAAATALLLLVATSALAVDPAQRTADMADSWLVLYNTNDASSVTWAAWYQAERGIPDQNEECA